MHILCWIPEATNTHFRNNTNAFSIATMVKRMHLNVAYSYTACLVWFLEKEIPNPET